jgi:hypothetical protein
MFVFALSALTAAGQFPCGCEKNPPVCHDCLCHTEELKNNAKVFYHYDCDSLYVTMLGTTGDTIQLFTQVMELTHPLRLVPRIEQDAQNTVLFNTYCSGGFEFCSWKLIDKSTGNSLADFNNIIFNDTLQNTILHMTDDYSLKLYVMDAKKEFNIEYSREKCEKAISSFCSGYSPRYFFAVEQPDATHLKVTYKILDEAISKECQDESIMIDLSEYLK